eukprot:12898396-Prorocentrum_lima.AAC.1
MPQLRKQVAVKVSPIDPLTSRQMAYDAERLTEVEVEQSQSTQLDAVLPQSDSALPILSPSANSLDD